MLKAQTNILLAMPCSYLLPSLCGKKWASNTAVLVQKSFTAPVGGAGTYLKGIIMSEDWNGPKKGKRSRGRKGAKTENV